MSFESLILALDSGNMWIRGVTIAAFVIVGYIVAMWIAMAAWAYRDAAARSTDPQTRWLAAGAVVLFNLPGLVLYLALRPSEPLVESYNRQLEAEALLREVSKDAVCATCRRAVGTDYVYCPYCTAQLQSACESCERLLQASWTMCPYCAAPRAADNAPAIRPAAAVPATQRPAAARGRTPQMAPQRAGATLDGVHPMAGSVGAAGR